MKKIIWWVIFVYCIAGLVYGISGLATRNLVGKEEVISPWIGVPLDIVSWPWMVYADWKNIGIKLQDVLTLAALILCIILIVYFKVRKKTKS